MGYPFPARAGYHSGWLFGRVIHGFRNAALPLSSQRNLEREEDAMAREEEDEPRFADETNGGWNRFCSTAWGSRNCATTSAN